MSFEEFFITCFFDNIGLYLCILGIILVLFIPIYKKISHSVCDPTFFLLTMTAFAYAMPFFLYYLDECSFRNLLYFLLSETVFWFFFFACRKKNVDFNSYVIGDEERVCKKFFYIAFILYFFCTVLTYVYVGIPLFARSRQNIYENALPGMALLAKLSSFGLAYVLFYSFHQILTHKRKLYYVYFLFALLTCLLSGSKGSILLILFSYFGYKYFFKNEKIELSLRYYLLIALFPLCTLMLSFESNAENISIALGRLLARFVANGDTYYMAYPDDIIDTLHYKNPFSNLFLGVLGPLRLVSYSNVEPLVGVNLYWIVVPGDYGMIAGPNARLAVMGWAYFKWMGLLLSACCGWFAAFLMYNCKRFFSHSILGVFLFFQLYSKSLSLLTDPNMVISNLFDLCLNVFIYVLFYLFISNFKIRLIKHKRINEF